MLAFDTSSIIHAWDHYPLKQFPRVWNWLGEEFKAGHLAMCKVAEEETKKRDADCCKWLHEQGVKILPVTQSVIAAALTIKNALGIVNDQYHPDGVGENDLLIIATCVEAHLDLVSNEGKQWQLPQNKARYKIPAVCAMPEVKVNCIDFRELVIQSSQVF